MRKLVVLVEAFVLAAGIVTIAAINPQTGQMMVAASRAAKSPQIDAEVVKFTVVREIAD